LDSLPEHEFSESEQVLLEALLSYLGEHDGFAFRNHCAVGESELTALAVNPHSPAKQGRMEQPSLWDKILQAETQV